MCMNFFQDYSDFSYFSMLRFWWHFFEESQLLLDPGNARFWRLVTTNNPFYTNGRLIKFLRSSKLRYYKIENLNYYNTCQICNSSLFKDSILWAFCIYNLGLAHSLISANSHHIRNRTHPHEKSLAKNPSLSDIILTFDDTKTNQLCKLEQYYHWQST